MIVENQQKDQKSSLVTSDAYSRLIYDHGCILFAWPLHPSKSDPTKWGKIQGFFFQHEPLIMEKFQ